MDSNPELEKLIRDALTAFDDWCGQHDSTDVEQFLAETKLPGRVIDEIRAHVQREQDLQEMLGVPGEGGGPDLDTDTVYISKVLPPPDAKPADAKQQRERIGHYKLLQKIGEGGMGTVWMAEQEQPVKRRVALKVIKAGMDSEQVIARFEAERQALAIMDHQNISRVLDGGVTDDGRPYFAMELVKGIPINTYCDNNKLSIEERLRLFIPVCHAVQHAHQKGIIHRDLKPTNVLVALYDGLPVPKVIDFGLAKALDHQTKLTDRTLFTEFGMIVGTLQYMSPEQAEMNAIDVDTRTDIYSLGVMLYELLTGSTPIERSTLKEQTMIQILNVIRTKDPPRPSIRLSESGEEATGISQQRRINPDRLSQLLKGELDWIVMKSIEKDRSRRYDSAKGFADDVDRYLNNEVVFARPPTAAYLFRKFVKRNQRIVGVAAAFGLLMVASTIAMAILWQKALAAERAAIEYSDKLEVADETTNQFLTKLTDDIGKELEGSEHASVDSSADPEERVLILSALNLTRIGLYIQLLGAPKTQTIKWFDKAVAAFEELDEVNRDKYANAYGTALENAGANHNVLGEHQKAVELIQRAMSVRKKNFDKNENRTRRSAYAITLMAAALVEDDKAFNYLTQMIDLLESDPEGIDKRLLSRTYFNRAYHWPGGGAEKIADTAKAIELYESFLKEKGGEPTSEDLVDLAEYYNSMLIMQTDPDQSRSFGLKAVEIVQKQLELQPNSAAIQAVAADKFYNFGNTFLPWDDGDAAKSLEWYDKSIAQLEKLYRRDSSMISQPVYYLAYFHRAEAQIVLRDFSKARNNYDVLLELLHETDVNPDIKKYATLFQLRWLRCVAEQDATEAVDQLNQKAGLTDNDYVGKPDALYTAAAIYSLASGRETDPDRKNDLKAKSVACLQALVDQNLFDDHYRQEISSNTDFDSIRNSDELVALLESIK